MKGFKRPCRKSGCTFATRDKSGYCEKHIKTDAGWFGNEKLKGSRHKRGYGTAWDKLRKTILERDGYLCQEHLRQGVITPGNHVDHIKPKAQGGTDEPNNLETLCKACHEKKTARERL